MDPSQKPRDLVPKDGRNRHLSAPKQGDLTPETADKVLKTGRPRAEGEEDPISKGRGGLEIFMYGIMLLFVVGYQLFSFLEQEGDGRLTDAPEVVAMEVDDQTAGEQFQLSGNRLPQPDCDTGRPAIQVEVGDIQGPVLGNLRLEVESENNEWIILTRGLPLGGAQVTAQVTIQCEEAP